MFCGVSMELRIIQSTETQSAGWGSATLRAGTDRSVTLVSLRSVVTRVHITRVCGRQAPTRAGMRLPTRRRVEPRLDPVPRSCGPAALHTASQLPLPRARRPRRTRRPDSASSRTTPRTRTACCHRHRRWWLGRHRRAGASHVDGVERGRPRARTRAARTRRPRRGATARRSLVVRVICRAHVASTARCRSPGCLPRAAPRTRTIRAPAPAP